MGLFDSSQTTTSNNQYQNQSQQQGTTQTVLPQNIQDAANQNLGFGMNAAYGWQPTMQQNPAGWTDQQMQALSMGTNAATNNPGSTAMDQALWGANNAVSYQPGQVQGQTYDPAQMAAQGYNAAQIGPMSGYNAAQAGPVVGAATQGYTAAQLGQAQGYTAAAGTAAQQARSNIQNVGVQNVPSQLPSYLQAFDPSYQTAVINSSMNDLDRARQLTQQSNAAQAAQQGAFGDTRQGVMDAQTNDAYLRNVANLSANLRQSGFNTALGALQGDTSNTLQSQLANQQADIGVSGQNVGAQNQFGLANLQAQNAAAQYQAGAQNQFAITNQAATNAASQFGAEAANQAAMQQAASQASTNLANAQAIDQARQYNAGLGLNVGQANQAALNQAGQYNAQLGFNVGQANQGALNQAGQYNAGNLQQAQLANQTAGLQGQNVNLAASGALMQGAGQQFNNAWAGAQNLYNMGAGVQNYNQGVQNTAYQNAQALAGAPLNQVGLAQQVLQNTPYGTTTNTSQTGTASGTSSGTQIGTYNPSVANDIGQTLKLISDRRLKTAIEPMFGGDDSGDDDDSGEMGSEPDDSDDTGEMGSEPPAGAPNIPKEELDNSDLGHLGPNAKSAFNPTVGRTFGAKLQDLNAALNPPAPPNLAAKQSGDSSGSLIGVIGGLAGLAALSDIKLKTDIRPMTTPSVKAVIGPPRPVVARSPRMPAPVVVGQSRPVGVAVANDPMSRIHKLQAVNFRWKHNGQPDSGFIAQNVAAAHPEAARNMGFGVQGYSLPSVVGLLSEGLKQVDRKVNAQRRGLMG